MRNENLHTFSLHVRKNQETKASSAWLAQHHVVHVCLCVNFLKLKVETTLLDKVEQDPKPEPAVESEPIE